MRSTRLWFEARAAKRSDGTAPLTDVYSCPSNFQVFQADDEQQAKELVDKLNAGAASTRGM